MEGCKEVVVDKPIPTRPHTSGRKDYSTPWALIASNVSPELSEFLLWQQTFAVNRNIAFHALPFDRDTKSWKILTISGDAVKNSPKARDDALACIKKTVWNSLAFRQITHNIYCSLGEPDTQDKCVVTATESWDLHYIECGNGYGTEDPAFILTGKPITSDQMLHQGFLAAIQAQDYMRGLTPLIINKKAISCIWCKSEMHPGFACTLLRSEGWQGPELPSNNQYEETRDRVRKRAFEEQNHLPTSSETHDLPPPLMRNKPTGRGNSNRGRGSRGGRQ
jgi:hypothetical protein